MKPTSEGQRLKALREALGATQELIAKLGGLQRVGIVRAENGQAKWRSSDLREGLMRAYSMTYEQLTAYLSGSMPIKEAIAIASAKVTAAINAGSAEKGHAELLADVFRRAGLQEDIMQATKDAMAVAYAEAGVDVPVTRMVQLAVDLNKRIRTLQDETARALKSDLRAPK